ncbi:MAG: hypothetical protein KDI13_05575 [Alphaproteobacteria bacterium]|nr:hypothetical protein [Alphaproteobacteria bacterium]
MAISESFGGGEKSQDAFYKRFIQPIEDAAPHICKSMKTKHWLDRDNISALHDVAGENEDLRLGVALLSMRHVYTDHLYQHIVAMPLASEWLKCAVQDEQQGDEEVKIKSAFLINGILNYLGRDPDRFFHGLLDKKLEDYRAGSEANQRAAQTQARDLLKKIMGHETDGSAPGLEGA